MVQHVEQAIRKLLTYRNRTFPIISVYLTIPQKESNKNEILIQQFHNLINTSLKPEDISLLQEDINYIYSFLQNYKQTNGFKTLVLFSGGNKLWEVITLYDVIPETIKIYHSPYVEPLFQVLSKYRRFLIVLADREKAKYFTFHMGQVETQGEIQDPTVPQKVKGRNMSTLAGKVDRHIQDHLNHHFNFIGQKVGEFVKNKQIAAVIIGGHKELMKNVTQHLPKDLQKKVVGEMISELNINMNEIVKKNVVLIEKINRQLNQQQQFSV